MLGLTLLELRAVKIAIVNYFKKKLNHRNLQGWRVTYYGAGIIALIIGILTWFTLKEPERKSIGEEETKDNVDAKKVTIWTVICDPRVIMLVLAASIRHCGKCNRQKNHPPIGI